MIAIVIGALGTVTKGLIKRLNDPNDNIIKIGQNTEEGPEY